MDKYGSKNSKYRRISKLHDRFKSYIDFIDVFHQYFWVFLLIWNQSSVDNWGDRRGKSVAVGVGDRWKVTLDM